MNTSSVISPAQSPRRKSTRKAPQNTAAKPAKETGVRADPAARISLKIAPRPSLYQNRSQVLLNGLASEPEPVSNTYTQQQLQIMDTQAILQHTSQKNLRMRESQLSATSRQKSPRVSVADNLNNINAIINKIVKEKGLIQRRK